MLLALAMSAATAHAGIPARFGGTPGVVNEDTLLYHDGTAQRPDKRLLKLENLNRRLRTWQKCVGSFGGCYGPGGAAGCARSPGLERAHAPRKIGKR